jgi:hypothetical protein
MGPDRARRVPGTARAGTRNRSRRAQGEPGRWAMTRCRGRPTSPVSKWRRLRGCFRREGLRRDDFADAAVLT